MQQYKNVEWSLLPDYSFIGPDQLEKINMPDGSAMKILLAVASPIERATYKAYLQNSSESYLSTFEAESIEQLQNLFPDSQPQCVVLDYSLIDDKTPDFIGHFTNYAAQHNCGVVLLVQAEQINAIAGQLKNATSGFLCKDFLKAEHFNQAIKDCIQAVQQSKGQELQKEWFAKASEDGSESRFQKLFECNLLPMGLWTMEGGIFAANEAMLHMFGCTMQELMNQKLTSVEWTPFEYQELDQKAITELKERGICTPYEKEVVGSDGKRIPVIIGGASFDGEGETGVFFALNLTELKLARQALRDSDARYSAIVEAMPEILFTALPNGQSDFINQQFYEYTGMTADEALGFGWFNALHSDDLEQTATLWRESVETGKAFEVEYRLRNTAKDYRWFRGRAVPLRDATGRIMKWFGVCMDITDRKVIEEEREKLLFRERQARDLAESANRAKDEFIALVSHELRTPLNAVLGWTNILRTQEVDEETFQHGLETIERSAKSQATLVEDLIDSAMISTGKMRIKMEKTNLVEIIQSALDVVVPAAEAKAVALKFHVATQDSDVLGDSSRLQQVMWNLLSNSVKFTPEGGLIEVTIKSSGKYAEIVIRDTGKGITAELLPMIFDSFQQADISRTRRFGGLGLGLFLVKQLVELHGGTVRAESPGENLGAVFTVNLPLRIRPSGMLKISKAKGLKQGEESKQQPQILSGLRILIVDDDPDAREISSIVLKQQGARVTQTASANEAFAFLSDVAPEFLPDLLISDIGMPDEDGYTLMRRVRALPLAQGGNIPAVALTAFSGVEDRRRALDSGFQAHLAKPIEPNELIKVVSEVSKRALSN
jgi:PAS domain S-box-containing protein